MNAPMQIPTIRLPPHSVEAEQAVIGGLLLDARAWDRVADVVAESDFYRDDHRRIFGHIARMADRGLPADVLTVSEAIKASNEVEQTGGLAYLAEIANETPSAANIRRHAEIIADRALRRRLITAGDEIASFAFSGMETARAAVDEAQGLLVALGDIGRSKTEPRPFAQAVADALTDIQANFERDTAMTGLPTGFTDIDGMLYGLQPTDLVIVAGRPSMGKTTFAMNIAENVALSGKRAMVFSLEMGDKQLAMRSLASIGGIEFERVRSGRLDDFDWDKMTAALGRLHDIPMIVDESGGLTVSQIAARARREARKAPLGLVVIDYLQLIRAGFSQTANNRNDEVSAISAGLKGLAKELGCPVIALSQLSRKVEERPNKRPVMSDLRDSGALEQDADVILLMYRDEQYNPESPWKGLAEAIIGKHRNGRTGTVDLVFEGQYCRFRNATHEAISAARQRAHELKPVKRSRGFREE